VGAGGGRWGPVGAGGGRWGAGGGPVGGRWGAGGGPVGGRWGAGGGGGRVKRNKEKGFSPPAFHSKPRQKQKVNFAARAERPRRRANSRISLLGPGVPGDLRDLGVQET
jgi:hypothetical protein